MQDLIDQSICEFWEHDSQGIPSLKNLANLKVHKLLCKTIEINPLKTKIFFDYTNYVEKVNELCIPIALKENLKRKCNFHKGKMILEKNCKVYRIKLSTNSYFYKLGQKHLKRFEQWNTLMNHGVWEISPRMGKLKFIENMNEIGRWRGIYMEFFHVEGDLIIYEESLFNT